MFASPSATRSVPSPACSHARSDFAFAKHLLNTAGPSGTLQSLFRRTRFSDGPARQRRLRFDAAWVRRLPQRSGCAMYLPQTSGPIQPTDVAPMWLRRRRFPLASALSRMCVVGLRGIPTCQAVHPDTGYCGLAFVLRPLAAGVQRSWLLFGPRTSAVEPLILPFVTTAAFDRVRAGSDCGSFCSCRMGAPTSSVRS